MLEATRTSGKALEVFARVIEAQGGDPSGDRRPWVRPSPSAAPDRGQPPTEAGYLSADSMHSRSAWRRCAWAPAGSAKRTPSIPAVGITVLVKPGGKSKPASRSCVVLSPPGPTGRSPLRPRRVNRDWRRGARVEAFDPRTGRVT